MKNILFVLTCFCSELALQDNNNIGLLSYYAIRSNDGYYLIYLRNQPIVYLLDNCGEIVHVCEMTSTSYLEMLPASLMTVYY